jgi:hypothetical protein
LSRGAIIRFQGKNGRYFVGYGFPAKRSSFEMHRGWEAGKKRIAALDYFKN